MVRSGRTGDDPRQVESTARRGEKLRHTKTKTALDTEGRSSVQNALSNPSQDNTRLSERHYRLGGFFLNALLDFLSSRDKLWKMPLDGD